MVQTKKIQLQTHRFLFSQNVIDCLTDFAKVHQFDERKVFKAEWQKYIEDTENKTVLGDEAKRLINEGFEGDPYDKFFKSVRYYYRKKLVNGKESSCDEEKSPRKEYETIGSEILRDMDEHIKTQIISNINNKDSLLLVSAVSPAESFDAYCNEFKSLILDEVIRSKEGSEVGKADIEAMISRFKKTYKNRFYKIRTVLSNN